MIGRDKEVKQLNELYNSGEAELVAIYGRRRVGKTYLVSETFAGNMSFHHAGLSPIELEESEGGTPLRKQLKHFYNSLLLHGMKKADARITGWMLSLCWRCFFRKKMMENVRWYFWMNFLGWILKNPDF